ncbi:hypothetical protein [Chishuiella changwenlii]|uniref:hypothetical protein n=1 Tax=Chishuiella changwenlii TaxID=1434701 RepID=UPI002FD93FDA
MNKTISFVLLLCFITNCNKKSEENKITSKFTENKIKEELISKTTILIDSVFNELSSDYLSLDVDSISIYKYIPLKGESLDSLEFSPMTALALDESFIDSFIKSINKREVKKDSIIGYMGFLKVRAKVSVREEYIPLLTEKQKLDAQRDIKGSKESYYIPNILTSEFKQFDLNKLNKN